MKRHKTLLSLLLILELPSVFLQNDNLVCYQTKGVTGSDGCTYRGTPGKRGERGPKGEKGESSQTIESRIEEFENHLQDMNQTLSEISSQFHLITDQIRNLSLAMGCPGVTFHLPRDEQTTDFVRYGNYVPRMDKATVCAWIGTDGTYRNIEMFFSYAVESEKNELAIAFVTGGGIRLSTGSKQTIQSIQIQPGLQTFHFCTWFTPSQAAFYINGQQRVNVTKSFNEVSGGGTLILGQDQDEVNGGFESRQSFSGNITYLMIWPRVLSDQEINNIATKCDCPQDYSVAMTKDRSELYGEAYSSVPEKCPTL